MQTTISKMGRSVGMIVPKAIFRELGASASTPMNVRIEGGEMAATLMRHPKAGWEEAATLIGAEPLTEDERDCMAFGNDGDKDLT